MGYMLLRSFVYRSNIVNDSVLKRVKTIHCGLLNRFIQNFKVNTSIKTFTRVNLETCNTFQVHRCPTLIITPKMYIPAIHKRSD